VGRMSNMLISASFLIGDIGYMAPSFRVRTCFCVCGLLLCHVISEPPSFLGSSTGFIFRLMQRRPLGGQHSGSVSGSSHYS